MHPLAGRPAPRSLLVSIPRLISAYYEAKPDPREPTERVAFGTSGHRGSSFSRSFNEAHIAAVSQAVCDYRRAKNIDGPLYLGVDTHGLSEPALQTALSVLAANGVQVRVDNARGFTPTPVISHAILSWNRGRDKHLADGIVITPSHNPPDDGGFKYNPPHGGPAETEITREIETNANRYLEENLRGVKRVDERAAWSASTTERYDYMSAYVADLGSIIDLPAIASAKLELGVDPLGGAAVAYWPRIAEQYGLDLTVVNDAVDPTFSFMRVDHDGKIRMDCSSPSAMASLVELRDRFDLAFGNDADVDRHGIVTPKGGLLNPNHFLAIAIDYLAQHRPGFARDAAVGKTLVSSSLIDRVAKGVGRAVHEVPVGFKWFVAGLTAGQLFFGGEESAGATFLRRDGSVWTTDKDGIIMDLLAAEIRAVRGKDLFEIYGELTQRYGMPHYARRDVAATPAQKKILGQLSPEQLGVRQLAGDAVTAALTHAPGNGASIGGVKVSSERGWFAARPSGTENVYKIYAESFVDPAHLQRIQQEAEHIVTAALTAES
ncbi:MAG TPA: phosphoglucomutase (alpha-D-glucose-1,6-bisphosphate-dependent) [Polyangiales bacterium]|nr:phosphoglucomutase (alpha-D-glucose-1,6-bisphosphate-dependent) [Polyangiales bacterium]